MVGGVFFCVTRVVIAVCEDVASRRIERKERSVGCR